MPPQGAKFDEREVAVHDPSLTPETNRLLTLELRRAVGADSVRVSAMVVAVAVFTILMSWIAGEL